MVDYQQEVYNAVTLGELKWKTNLSWEAKAFLVKGLLEIRAQLFLLSHTMVGALIILQVLENDWYWYSMISENCELLVAVLGCYSMNTRIISSVDIFLRHGILFCMLIVVEIEAKNVWNVITWHWNWCFSCSLVSFFFSTINRLLIFSFLRWCEWNSFEMRVCNHFQMSLSYLVAG